MFSAPQGVRGEKGGDGDPGEKGQKGESVCRIYIIDTIIDNNNINDYNSIDDLLLLSCPSHNFFPLAGACLCPLCHYGQFVSRTPRLAGDRRGGGPSYVAPRSPNHPTGRRRDNPISSSLFSHGPPVCAVSQGLANRASPLQIQPAKARPPPVPF